MTTLQKSDWLSIVQPGRFRLSTPLAVVLFVLALAFPQAGFAQWATATGGNETIDYVDAEGIPWRAHIFTNTGSQPLEITFPGTVEYLIVGGGGGGGGAARNNNRRGGGGGAGGLLTGSLAVSAGTHTIHVGQGGSAGPGLDTGGNRGGDGGNSVAFGLTARGGGGGGGSSTAERPGRNGGSGGGSAGGNTDLATGEAGPPRQGHNGGSGGARPDIQAAGGGGGAGSAAGMRPSPGEGLSLSFPGPTPVIYATGGQGGALSQTQHGQNGLANTGNGGGGGASASTSSGAQRNGGSGGSGIVIVRYQAGPIIQVSDPDAMQINDGAEVMLVAAASDVISKTFAVANSGSSSNSLLLTNSPDAVVFQENGSTSFGGFSISENTTETELAPGQSTPFTLQFSAVETGEYSATITIQSNDPLRSVFTIDLTVVVIPGFTSPALGTQSGAVSTDPTTATLNGILTAGGAADSVYFVWGTEPGSANSIAGWQHVIPAGSRLQGVPFEANLSGLSFGQQYHYMVVAQNPQGTAASAIVPFVTQAPESISLSLTEVSPVRDTSAVLQGSLNAPGSVFTVTAYWSETDHANEAAWLAAAAAGTAQASEVGTFNDVLGESFSHEITNLTQGTHYYTTLIATNAVTTLIETPNVSFETFLTAPGIAVLDGSRPVALGDNVFLGAIAPGETIHKAFTLTNFEVTGFADLLLSGSPVVVFDETGTDSYNGFKISSNIFGGDTTLSPGESASFTVSFGPSSMGRFTGTVRIANNDPTQNPFLYEIEVLCGNRVGEISNPYAAVDWDTFEVHMGNFHNHTVRSDSHDHTIEGLILDYHSRGYTALAITDHNNPRFPASSQISHPWQQFTYPPIIPEEMDPPMVDIPGSELSEGDHIVSLFSTYNSRISDVGSRLAGIGNAGGIGYFAHPGRYSRSAQFYANHYAANPHIFGQAIYNQGDRYQGDRAKWDQVLSITMPERPVWGISEDDTHRFTHVGMNRNYLLMPYLSHDNVREALLSGAFFATHSGPNDSPPQLTGVDIDDVTGTITLSADFYHSVRWISMGEEIAQGLVLDIVNTPGVERYVRAELQGPEGTTFTNPFGITPFFHVVSLSPPNQATEVVLSEPLVVSFNEDIKKGTGAIVLRESGGNVVETIDVDSEAVVIEGATVTVGLSAPLGGIQTYYVEIEAGAFLNLDDEPYPGIFGDQAWRFTTTVPDNTPPSPDPMAFAMGPYASGPDTISMIAVTATDDSPPIEYLFENITLNRDSGWILETEWSDSGLAFDANYTYRVKAREGRQ